MTVVVILAFVFVANIITGIFIQRSGESNKRKVMFALAVWMLPVIGVLIFWITKTEKSVDVIPDNVGGFVDEFNSNIIESLRASLGHVESDIYQDWERIYSWLDTHEAPELAYADVRRAWLLYLKRELGGKFRLFENPEVMLLSTQSDAAV